MVKAVIFDLWGTVLENGVFPSPCRQVLNILRLDMPFSEFIMRFEKVFMTKKYDSLADAFNAVCKEFEISPPGFVVEKLVGMWNKHSILARFFPDSIDALSALKKDYKLILLTNTDMFAFKQVNDKFKFDELFDRVYASFDTGMLKINPKILKIILADFGLKKEDVIIVGDSIESDMQGAKIADVSAVLVDRRDRQEFEPKIASLLELDDYLKAL